MYIVKKAIVCNYYCAELFEKANIMKRDGRKYGN